MAYQRVAVITTIFIILVAVLPLPLTTAGTCTQGQQFQAHNSCGWCQCGSDGYPFCMPCGLIRGGNPDYFDHKEDLSLDYPDCCAKPVRKPPKGFKMEITPSRYTVGSNGTVQIYCHVKSYVNNKILKCNGRGLCSKTDYVAHQHLEVFQGKKRIAGVYKNAGVSRGKNTPKTNQVQGKVSSDGGNSFIKITIPSTQNGISGTYVCSLKFEYLDPDGDDIASTVTSTTASLTMEKRHIPTQFRARIGGGTKWIWIGVTSVVVFNSVDLNIDQGYSSDTGVFTAPRRGFYSFTVNMAITPTCWKGECYGSVYLKVNDETPAGTRTHNIKRKGKLHLQEARFMKTVKLEIGDKVQVVMGSTPKILIWLLVYPDSYFVGSLVQAP